jgi:hypothetical protein
MVRETRKNTSPTKVRWPGIIVVNTLITRQLEMWHAALPTVLLPTGLSHLLSHAHVIEVLWYVPIPFYLCIFASVVVLST